MYKRERAFLHDIATPITVALGSAELMVLEANDKDLSGKEKCIELYNELQALAQCIHDYRVWLKKDESKTK